MDTYNLVPAKAEFVFYLFLYTTATSIIRRLGSAPLSLNLFDCRTFIDQLSKNLRSLCMFKPPIHFLFLTDSCTVIAVFRKAMSPVGHHYHLLIWN